MRIIAGTARGRQIQAPKGRDTRPTLDRVKEAMFSMIQFRIPDSTVLDLFAGSGNLGLEALSRGARYAVLNDHSRTCCELIRQNAALLRMTDRTQVMQMDFLQALTYLAQAGQKFDLVFLDPPYAQGPQIAAEKIADMGLLVPQGLIVAEHAWDRPPEAGSGLNVVNDRKYGDVGVCLLEYGGEK